MEETREIRVSLRQVSDYEFNIRFDETPVPDLHTDEEPPLGGATGPNPSRLLAAAVANCLSASLLFALRKFHNQPGTLQCTAVARLGRNESGRLRVTGIEAGIELAEAAGAHQNLDRLLGQFEQFCIVTESVRQGIPVSVRVSDVTGAVLHDSGPASG